MHLCIKTYKNLQNLLHKYIWIRIVWVSCYKIVIIRLTKKAKILLFNYHGDLKFVTQYKTKNGSSPKGAFQCHVNISLSQLRVPAGRRQTSDLIYKAWWFCPWDHQGQIHSSSPSWGFEPGSVNIKFIFERLVTNFVKYWDSDW